MKKQINLILIIFGLTAILSGCFHENKTEIDKTNDSSEQNTENQTQSKKSQLSKTISQKNSQTFSQRMEGAGCKDEEYQASFRADFNLDPANKTYAYVNYDNGISFDIPYNKKWGNSECKVNPYSGGNNLFFGLPSPWGPDEFMLEIKKKESASQIINSLELDVVDEEAYPSLPKIININNLETVLWGDKEMLETIYIEIIGEINNYRFSTAGEQNIAITKLENIIKTINLID